ncbi:odorant receptor 49b-like [Anabrus simplex]|uniref:odorant receptor 49b-like n=1 Tax=Anabrus simplex TaxID=316456 RepID=UPI0035A3AE58
MREMERCLVECIIHHQRILRFAMELENVFNPSMLAQLLISVMLFCLSFVQVIVSPLMSLRMVTVLGILTYASVELFMFCWFCEQLSSEGVAVQQAAYDSEWYNASLRYRHLVRFLIQRAQRPPEITAGKFFALSLERFKQVVQVSYSYFTVLMRNGEF